MYFLTRVSPCLVSPLLQVPRKLPDAPQTPRLHIIWHLSPLVQTLPASLSWRNTTVRLPSVCVIGSKVFLFLLLPISSESHSSSAHGSQTQHNKQGSDGGATLGKHGIPSHVAACCCCNCQNRYFKSCLYSSFFV